MATSKVSAIRSASIEIKEPTKSLRKKPDPQVGWTLELMDAGNGKTVRVISNPHERGSAGTQTDVRLITTSLKPEVSKVFAIKATAPALTIEAVRTNFPHIDYWFADEDFGLFDETRVVGDAGLERPKWAPVALIAEVIHRRTGIPADQAERYGRDDSSKKK